jgi:aminoacyl-tRNA hydrolase
MDDIAAAVESFTPTERRMQPFARPDGVTFIRDEFKAPLASVAPALRFLRDASAPRRIAVIGTISDCTSATSVYRRVATEALESADLVIVVGPNAPMCARTKKHPKEHALHLFLTFKAAADFLAGTMRAGDLVLLKGSPVDKLDRFVSVAMRPAAAAAETAPPPPPASSPPDVRIVVGLGNPGREFEDTLHNVGQRALDRIADRLRAAWQPTPHGVVARASWRGRTLHLIKPGCVMNESGPTIRKFTEETGCGPESCVLMHDDLNLPIGAVRTRLRGTDGGHRGMRSVLESFETDMVARVKIGVGSPEKGKNAKDHVLRPFSASEAAAIDEACDVASERLLELVVRKPEAVAPPA